MKVVKVRNKIEPGRRHRRATQLIREHIIVQSASAKGKRPMKTDVKTLRVRTPGKRDKRIYLPMYSVQDDIYRKHGKAALKFVRRAKRAVKVGPRANIVNPLDRDWNFHPKSSSTVSTVESWSGRSGYTTMTYNASKKPLEEWVSPGDICLSVHRRREDAGEAGDVYVARPARSFAQDGRMTWQLQQRAISMKKARSLRFCTERDGKKFFTYDCDNKPADFYMPGHRAPETTAAIMNVTKNTEVSAELVAGLRKVA